MREILFDSYSNPGASTEKASGGIDLKGLPIPDIVETISYDDVLNGMFKRLVGLMPELQTITASDPVYKILEVCAYRETLLRARVNHSVNAMLLVSAKKNDLDNIAANFNIQRKVIKEEDRTTSPPTPAIMESDDDLRRRIQLSFDGFTTAGSEASYLFHTLNADSKIRDAYVRTKADPKTGITSGVVEIFLLTYDKTKPESVRENVIKHVGADIRRPLTDKVEVNFVKEKDVGDITAVLHLFEGVTSTGVVERAKENLIKYINTTQKIGRQLALSGIYKALHITGVESVTLTAPTADITVGKTEVATVDPSKIKISLPNKP